VSDGTVSGTSMVKNISSADLSFGVPDHFAVLGTRLLFAATHSNTNIGRELWTSDGTEANTSFVKDIANGASWADPEDLVTLGTNVYFSADNNANGRELWTSDGTFGGTSLLKNIRSDPNAQYLSLFTNYSSNPTFLTVMGVNFYFNAHDGTHGEELWVSDGTAGGTSLLKDIRTGSSDSSPMHMTAMGSKIYFQADDGTHGKELWVSDGTAGGTSLLKDIRVGLSESRINHTTAFNNSMLFFKADNAAGNSQLWVSNGTAAGTSSIVVNRADVSMELGSWSNDRSAVLLWLADQDPQAWFYFAATDGTHGKEIWQSNGNTAYMRKDIRVGSSGSNPKHMAAMGSRVYFQANDGVHGAELWRASPLGPASTTTVLVKDINIGSNGSNPMYLFEYGNKIYFQADDGTHGKELWVSDGTPAGTSLFMDIRSGGDGEPQYFAEAGSKLYFQANADVKGVALFVSNGTVGGTSILADSTVAANPKYMVGLQNNIYFQANDTSEGVELFVSNGTTAGTSMLKNIRTGSGASSFPESLTLVGDDKILFLADDGTHGQELWCTKGTANTTTMVKDSTSGLSGSNITSITPGPVGKAYFQFQNSMWTTLGSRDSTMQASPSAPAGSVMQYPVVYDSVAAMYFSLSNEYMEGGLGVTCDLT